MQFKLIQNGDGLRKHDVDTLIDMVNQLDESNENYIVLEPKNPIRNSLYIQVVYKDSSYHAEIRFISGTNDNFRHYSKIYGEAQELLVMLSDYYLKEKVPNIQDWSDDTSLFKEVVDADMTKLYKFADDQIYYFEVWLDEIESIDYLTVHEGIVGEIGETEEFSSENQKLPMRVLMSNFLNERRELGYIESPSLIELIVQYQPDNNVVLAEQVEEIESLFNNCLGWTGNGHCEGADVNPNIIYFICYVIDTDIAIQTLLALLKDHNLLRGVCIACEDANSEGYSQLYPESGKFIL